jgi:hypothetical protein
MEGCADGCMDGSEVGPPIQQDEAALEKVELGHTMQLMLLIAAILMEYLPAVQLVHADAPSFAA